MHLRTELNEIKQKELLGLFELERLAQPLRDEIMQKVAAGAAVEPGRFAVDSLAKPAVTMAKEPPLTTDQIFQYYYEIRRALSAGEVESLNSDRFYRETLNKVRSRNADLLTLLSQRISQRLWEICRTERNNALKSGSFDRASAITAKYIAAAETTIHLLLARLAYRFGWDQVAQAISKRTSVQLSRVTRN